MSRLDDAMIRLAAETGAPPEIERAVLAEFDRLKRRKRGLRWIAATGAIAASVAVVWLVDRPARQPVAPPSVEAEAEQPFVPIPYVLPPGPYERVEVVRMRLPVSALIAAGFRMQTADLGAEAEADVIVGQDGRPRAVRLISISSFE
jgi:hypothetical protein